MSQTTFDKSTESSENTATEQTIIDRLEGLLSFGPVHCDVCNRLPADERPDEGEYFPDTPTVYVTAGVRTLADWKTKVCDYHDEPSDHAPDATHRLTATTELAEDHHHNGSFRYTVESIEDLEA